MTTGNSSQPTPGAPARKGGGPEAAASGDPFQTLVALPPQTDRATLVRTIDAAVATVLRRLQEKEPGQPLGDELIRLTRSAIDFLEACTSVQDADFGKQTKVWAAQLQEAFGAAAASARPAGPPPRKAPAPSKPAGPSGEKRPAAAAKPPSAGEAFRAAFEASLCRHIRRRAEAFEVPVRNQERLPFVLAPAFSVVLEQIVKARFVPPMAGNRRLRGLANSLNAADLENGLMAVYAEPGGNVVRALWDEMWAEVIRGLENPAPPPQKARVKREKKQSWIDRFGFGKRDDDEEDDGQDAPGYDPELARQVWHALEAGAIDGNFDPPRIADLAIIRMMFGIDVEAVDEAKRSAKQLLQQEAAGQAREGVTRDFLNQQFKLLPAPCGEMLALWTYFQHRDQFNYKILRSFQASHGQTAEQRRKFLPLFMRWVPDFTTVKVQI